MHFSLPVAVHVAITCQYLSLYCTQLSRTRVQRLLAIPTEKRITTTTYIWTSWIGARPHGLESTCISTVEASFKATAIHVGVSIEKWLQSLGYWLIRLSQIITHNHNYRKSGNCEALQLEGRMTSRQSFWANIYTTDTLRHATIDLWAFAKDLGSKKIFRSKVASLAFTSHVTGHVLR